MPNDYGDGLKGFDDLEINAMVRRAWGGKRCPTGLRDRVVLQIRSQSRTGSDPLNVGGGLRIPWCRSAAAVIGLAAGAGLMAIRLRPVTSGPSVDRAAAAQRVLAFDSSATRGAPPAPVAAELVRIHDQCRRAATPHRLDVDGRVDASLAVLTRPRVARSTLVTRPADRRWSFRAAAVRKVGATRVGQLIFDRGDLTLSVFSLLEWIDSPVRGPSADGAGVENDRTVVFTRKGEWFCLVGSRLDAPFSTGYLDRLLASMYPPVAIDVPVEPPATSGSDLLADVAP